MRSPRDLRRFPWLIARRGGEQERFHDIRRQGPFTTGNRPGRDSNDQSAGRFPVHRPRTCSASPAGPRCRLRRPLRHETPLQGTNHQSGCIARDGQGQCGEGTAGPGKSVRSRKARPRSLRASMKTCFIDFAGPLDLFLTMKTLLVAGTAPPGSENPSSAFPLCTEGAFFHVLSTVQTIKRSGPERLLGRLAIVTIRARRAA